MMEPAEQLRHTALEIAEKADEILGQIERMASCDVIITLKPFEVPTYTVKKCIFQNRFSKVRTKTDKNNAIMAV